MLCVPITATTTEDFLTDMRSASELVSIDTVELRLDYISNIRISDVAALIKEKTIPVIATCRPEREGGRFTGTEAESIALLEKAAELGAEYVDIEHDVEHDAVDKFTKKSGTKLIVSYHNFSETPSESELRDLYNKLSSSGADIVKIVTLARTITDNLRIFKLLEQASKPTIALCMGEPGQISRVLAPKYGSFLSFASLGEGRESAPGQLSARELLDVYNFRAIDHDTHIYGLIGNPVAHSMGPVLHNTCFQAEDINAVYLPFRVEDISSFINGFKALNVSGYSVTIPHKQAIMGLLDELDPLATSVGAVNTVVNRGGRLKGYNTDSTAATKVIEEGLAEDGMTLKGKKVTIVGAGGAARAVAFGLKQKKAEITIVNRTEARAEALAGDLGCGHRGLSELGEFATDILVNCTSVGMHPDINDMPVPADVLRPGMWVFDAIYNPPETRLLREAAARGCRTLDGVKMFVLQAAQQFEIWTGRPAPVQPMEGIIRFRLAAMK
ncbi:MAG: shikimate dehydrogenase [Planctomycetota bacterium]|jgi:3-dehydroquinate dehydratase/shikimate dehydrogenase